MKRKALWTRAFPGQVRGTLKRPRRVRQRSTLKAVRDRLYAKVRAAYLLKHRACKVALLLPGPGKGKLVPATQVHHSRGRNGPLLIDERFFVSVSAENHDWIDRNKADARRLGLLCDKGLFNSPPKDAESERLREIIRKAANGTH